MSDTPNRLKPKTTFPLSLPVNSSATTHNSSSNTIISTPPPQPLPYTSSLDKFSPPPSPREVDTNFSKKNSMASEGDLRKKSLPEIRSPPHPSALLRERDRENGNTPSTPQNNIGPLHPNGGGGSGTTPLTGRGHRRGLGSRGSFDQSSASAPTSFDSTETSFILDDVAMPIGTGISLSAKQVRHLFPYHIAVNYDFQISQMGNALANFLKQRTLIRIPTTDHIGKYFRIVSTSASSSGSTWDWYQLTAQSNAVNSVLASLSASTSSTSSSFIVNHSQHHQTHSHQTRELTIELELSKDFLLQETSAPFRLTGTLHRIMPKEDAEALCFTAFFLLSPKIQSAEDMKIWQISSASELPHHSFQAENIHLLEEKRHSQETIAQQQQTIQRLEAELHNLKQSQSTAAASSTSTESTAVGDVRQLIGNVTHDLKTPLGGFLNGVDLIKEYVEELGVAIDAMRQSNSPTLSPPQSRGEVVAVEEQERMRRKEEESIHLIAAMEEKIESIRGKIKDISDINSFMTMTINRCIDYAKVGQNLKLKPKLETVDLLDTLYLPLSCMNSLQTRIPITLDPVDDNICSTVITDKQWLQENLLCLLSNAVKYSHEGDITVRMFVHPPTGAAATQTKENPTAMKYITRLTERQRQQFSLPRTNRHSFHSGARTSTNSIASSPNQIPHRMRTKSLTNEDYQNARIDANSPRGSGGATGPRQHTQHPSLDLTSHLGRLRANDLSDSNSSSSPKILTSQSITALPSLGKPSSTTTVVMTNKGPLTLDIPQIVDYELSTNQFLVFEVEDRGTGIKEEVRDTLFSPFQQAQRLAGGTGLGLFSLAKRLEALYGYFGVDGRRDAQRGSLFWFAIPYRPDEEVSKHLPPTKAKYCELSKQLSNLSNKSSLRTPIAHYQPPSSRDLLNTPPKPSRLESIRTQRLIDVTSHVTASLTPRHQLNILLVDDSMPILKTVRHALIKKGYEVDSSHNGLDCLDKVQKRITSSPTPYDVILMDLNMPVLDGLEATKRLRQLEQDEALGKSGIRHVIIGVSANSDEDTILDALSAGVDDFICKPFTMDTFAATLRKLQLIS